MSLLSDLKNWRATQARIEGVEPYRVLTNAVLDAIVGTLPENKEALLGIKGIKEARFQKYGQAILKLVREHAAPQAPSAPEEVFAALLQGEDAAAFSIAPVDETLSVSQFLDGINTELSGMASRIRGEVTSLSEREWWIYFTIKDSQDESTLSCLIARRNYDVSGVHLAVGDEIVVEGYPEVYKPSGRFSLKATVVELFGEGALKKAYDELFRKLEAEGLFAEERKRPLPEFPERIALVTSRDGAAIDDFKMNLGPSGLRVDFFPTNVEGKRAVFDIIEAVRHFNRAPERYDLLVIVRGGGSLESLQAFNNETLAREVASSAIPTLCGIGHEKDVTLAALVADRMVSTPTAAAKLIAAPWTEARQILENFTRHLPLLFQERLSNVESLLRDHTDEFFRRLDDVKERVSILSQALRERLAVTLEYARAKQQELPSIGAKLLENFRFIQVRVGTRLEQAEERLGQYDPLRALKLGYSLIRQGGRVIKDSAQLARGDILDIQFGKGGISAEVKQVIE